MRLTCVTACAIALGTSLACGGSLHPASDGTRPAPAMGFRIWVGVPRADSLRWIHREMSAPDGSMLRHDSLASSCLSDSLNGEALRRAGTADSLSLVIRLPSLYYWTRFTQLSPAPSDTLLLMSLALAAGPEAIDDMRQGHGLAEALRAADPMVLVFRCVSRQEVFAWYAAESLLLSWPLQR